MNYTIPDNRPFISTKPLKMKAKITPHRAAVEEFMRTHDLFIRYDHELERAVLDVREKKEHE